MQALKIATQLFQDTPPYHDVSPDHATFGCERSRSSQNIVQTNINRNLNVRCDFELEHTNSTFLLDTLAYYDYHETKIGYFCYGDGGLTRALKPYTFEKAMLPNKNTRNTISQ